MNEALSAKILELCGGKENVISATSCMTRLRVNLKDKSKADLEAMKKLEGILGVIDDKTIQIVLGPGKASKITKIFCEQAGVSDELKVNDWQSNKEAIKEKQKQSKGKDLLRTLANIFIPLIPAVIAGGLFFGLASLIGQVASEAVASKTGFVYLLQQLFSLFGGSFLGYFAIYTGVNAAREFNATLALGGMIGGISIGPQIVAISTALGLYNADIPLDSILTTGKGGIIGVILGVWILSKVEAFFHKHVPDVLDLIVTPFLTILFVGTLYVLVLMPITGWISDGLVYVLSFLINSTNPVISVISGYVLAAVFLPMVLLGLHHGLISIYALQLEALGGISLFPVLAMAGAGQVGAAIAIYIKCKKVGNKQLQKTIIGALPAGFLGVGEPLIYGVTLPLGKSFVTAGLGAGFGGAYVMLMHVMAVAWGPSGLVAIPLMQTPFMMFHYFIGLVIAYVAGFIVTFIGIKAGDVKNVA